MILILEQKNLINRVQDLPFGVLFPQLQKFHIRRQKLVDITAQQKFDSQLREKNDQKKSIQKEITSETQKTESQNTQLTLEIQTLKDRYEQMKALRTENQLEEISTEEQANASFAKMGIEPEQVKEKLATNDKWKSRDMNSTQLATFMDTVFQLQQS